MQCDSLFCALSVSWSLCFLSILVGLHKPDLVVISSQGNEWVAEELTVLDRACGSPDTETQTVLFTPNKSDCLLIRVGSRKKEPVARLNFKLSRQLNQRSQSHKTIH